MPKSLGSRLSLQKLKKTAFEKLKKSLLTKQKILFCVLIASSFVVYGQSMFYHLLGRGIPDYTWTGLGPDANWTTALNWSGNIVPGASDTAHFMGTAACTSNCSPTINASISIGGMDIQSSYSGTITQGTGNTITVGSGAWTQASGTFVGSNANITVNAIFTLSGGTFTSTSAEFLITSGWTYSAGTFNHNNGLLRFTTNGIIPSNTTIQLNLPGAVDVYDLQYSGGFTGSTAHYTVNIASGSFNVLRDFYIGTTTASAAGTIFATGGTINLKRHLIAGPAGTVNGPTSQTSLIMNGPSAQSYTASSTARIPNLTIDNVNGVTPTGGTTAITVASFNLNTGAFSSPSSGTLTVHGDFTIASGTTYTHNGSSITFSKPNVSSSPTYTITLPAALTVQNLSFGGGVSGSNNTTTWVLAGAVPEINAAGNFTIGNTNTGTGNIILNGGLITVGGNYTANAYSGTGTTAITINGTGAQSFTKTGAGGNQTGTITVNKASNTFSLASAASFNTGPQNFTISAGTMDLVSYALAVGNVLTIASGAKLICGTGSATAASWVISGEISCGTGQGISWTGATGDGLWATAGNWTNNNVPGASDVAIFNGACSGANCNATMSSTLSVRGINMRSDYTGTLTAGTTLTVGTAGWTQAAGTFVGGSSTTTVNGPFALSGGTFNASTGTWTMNGNFTVSGSPTFTHNSGTFSFPATSQTIIPSTVSYGNVTFGGAANSQSLSGGTMTIEGNLILNDTSSCCWLGLNNGTLDVKGNVSATNYGKAGNHVVRMSGTTSQSLTGVSTAFISNLQLTNSTVPVSMYGTIRINQNFTNALSMANPLSSTMLFDGNSTIVPGTTNFNNVILTGNASSLSLSSGTMTVGGTLTIGDTASCCWPGLNSGTIDAKGPVSIINYGKTGSALIRISGTTSQDVISTSLLQPMLPNFQISSTGGSVLLSGQMKPTGTFTYSSGVVDATNSSLYFHSTQTIVPGTMAFNNVQFGGTQPSQTLSGGVMTVNGTLSFNELATCCWASLSNGTIEAYGDVSATNYGRPGTVLLKLKGSGTQTFTGVSTAFIPDTEINSSGTVNLAGTLNFWYPFKYTAGTVNGGTSTLLFSNSTTITPGSATYNNATFNGAAINNTISGTLKTAGTLTLADSNAAPGSLSTGTLAPSGNVTLSSYGKQGNATLDFQGSTTGYFTMASTAKFPTSTLNISKTGGASVYMSSDVSVNMTAGQDLYVNSGTLNLNSFDLTVLDVLNVAPGAGLTCAGGDFTAASYVLSGTISCPGYAAYPYNWTGAALDGLWSTATNWSGGAVPNSTAVVVFDDAYCGANCNATIDTSINIRGVQMKSGYTGTITQGSGVNITIGSKNWTQNGGTFTGNSGTMTLSSKFTLAGASSTFSSPTSMTITGNFTAATLTIMDIGASSTWTPPTTMTISKYYAVCSSAVLTIDVPTSLSFNDLVVDSDAGCSAVYIAPGTGDTITILGNLTMSNGGMNGNWELRGNLTASANADGGTGVITINHPSNNQTYAVTSAGTLPGLKIDKPAGTVTESGSSGYIAMNTFVLTQGSFTSPTSMTLKNNAGTNAVIFQVASGTTFTAPTNLTISNYYNVCGAGTFYMDVPTTLTLNNLTANVSAGCGIQALSTSAGDTIHIAGNLTTSTGYMTGTWTLAGNYTVSGGAGGTGVLTFNGTGTQTVTRTSGTAIGGAITINKTSGAVALGSAMSFSTASQDLVITQGTLNMSGYNLSIARNVNNSGSIVRGANPSCGTLSYGGSFTGNATTCP